MEAFEMSSSVIVRLNVDGGPDLELTPAAARDLWEQLNRLFGDQQESEYRNPLDSGYGPATGG